MKDFAHLPLLPPKEAVRLVSGSRMTVSQKLLISSLITAARSFSYRMSESQESLLILDVTHFLNHRVNTKLINAIGKETAEVMEPFNPDIILTAPSSGNIPAIVTSLHLSTMPDVIYAPKGMPITMHEVYQSKSRSYTYGGSVDLTVSKECLKANTRVVIGDDFLDTGKTALDLTAIVRQAGATVVAFFFVIEKPFSGREKLLNAGFSNDQIFSLVKIEAMREGLIKIAGFDAWFELSHK